MFNQLKLFLWSIVKMHSRKPLSPILLYRPKPLLTDNTDKFRRDVRSTRHRLRRRLDPLHRQQELHPLGHPAVLLPLVVVVQPLLLREVHVTKVATEASVCSKDCSFLFCEAAFKQEGSDWWCNLCWSLDCVHRKFRDLTHQSRYTLTWQMPQVSFPCWASSSFIFAIAFWCSSSMLQMESSSQVQKRRKQGGSEYFCPPLRLGRGQHGFLHWQKP